MVKSVLFVCNMNSVRSPMAAAMLARDSAGALYVDSAGVYEGAADPFIPKVLDEIGVSLGDYEPKAVGDINLADFDLIIALTPEAASEIRLWQPRERLEFWPIENPSDARGGREEILAAYRAVRDEMHQRMRARFPKIYEKP